MASPRPGSHVAALVDGLGFPLDRFQRDAADAIDGGRSVLVAAPTGAGKTVVAEYAVADALDHGQRAFYTTPIKALSNQKFGELRDRYGTGRAGLLTGDNSIDGDAPVVVMTTEVLRNMIYSGRPLDDLGVVVLDEVHYLQNSFRGPVWEEVIVHLPEHVRLVCLSATVSNVDDIGDWLTTVRGPTDVVVEHERPVSLTNTYLVGDKSGGRLRLVDTLVDGRPNPEGARFDVDRDQSSGRDRSRGRSRGGNNRRRWFTPNRLEVLQVLEDTDLLPAIAFIFSRAACDDAVKACLDAGVRLTTREDRRRIREIADRHLAVLEDADFRALGGERWLRGLEAGVASHHAGHVPPFKEAVEACFAEGLVKLVFATETLALGINMPARSVVIERMTKFNGESRAFLTPAEYTQLTGRAGRRGIDTHGTAVVLWSPFVAFAQIAGLASSRSFVLRSAFRPTYNMAVNLIRRHDRESARRLLNQSLAQYQADRAVVVTERRLVKRRAALDQLLGEASCELGDVAEYRELAQTDLPRRERRRRLEARLDDLSPGDVIALDDQPRVAVLSVAHRSGERIKVKVVSPDGDVFTVGMPDFDHPPEVLATLTLPEPFQPADPRFQASVAEDLHGATVATPARRGSAVDHPVASCPDADEHLRALERAERVRREVDELTARIDHQSGTLGLAFERVLEVLGEFGYVDGWTVTARGDLLAGVYHESDLVVAEAIAAGCFDDLDAPELAAVASALVYEHRAPGPPPEARYPSDRVEDRCRDIDAIVRSIVVVEERVGLPTSSGGDHNFARLAHEWCAGESLGSLLDDGDIELTGGDFVRTVRQLVDLVRQIGQLADDPTTRTTARRAVGALERGVVAATVEAEAENEDQDEASGDGDGAEA
ncbi:DEAD/DEAH box helicase [Actinospongicola halichondriae]|uniref:DEAD/DEAH box helicase n=1 Tax=Actinospongicola halichondriae TaxID=3236844 RepID=UPI003D3BD47E